MGLLAVAGKNDSGNASAFSVNDLGEVKIQHEWKYDSFLIVDSEEIRSTDAVWSTGYDVSKYATLSLRIYSNLDQPVSLIFSSDANASNTTYMKNYGGSNLGFTIPDDSGTRMITPEEFPFLQYLVNMRIRMSCSTAPTSGHISIRVIGKY